MLKTCLLKLLLPLSTISAFASSSLTCSSSSGSKDREEQVDPKMCRVADNNSNSNNNKKMYRSVRRLMPRPPRHWVGDGFHVYPIFADMAFKQDISPLLMYDYAAPKDFPPSDGSGRNKPRGVGQHPHRGFETVTIAFQGEVEHKDSTGKSGVIQPGDVQWMTAGRGIIHQEYHSNAFSKEGGAFEMCQLWVNLPKKHKMTKPGYQGIKSHNIPIVNLPLQKKNEDDGTTESQGHVRVIAGNLNGTKGAAKTFSPVQMWDVSLPKVGSEIELPFPADQNCMVFVRRGGLEVLSSNDGGRGEEDDEPTLKASPLGPQDLALMRNDDGSDLLKLRVMEPDTSLIIMGGEPLNEPIAHRGPFVMNTQQQLHQAMLDYQTGKMGK